MNGRSTADDAFAGELLEQVGRQGDLRIGQQVLVIYVEVRDAQVGGLDLRRNRAP